MTRSWAVYKRRSRPKLLSQKKTRKDDLAQYKKLLQACMPPEFPADDLWDPSLRVAYLSKKLCRIKKSLNKFQKLEEQLHARIAQVRRAGDETEANRRHLVKEIEWKTAHLESSIPDALAWNGLLKSPNRSPKSAFNSAQSYTRVHMLIFETRANQHHVQLQKLRNYVRDMYGFSATVITHGDTDITLAQSILANNGLGDDSDHNTLYILFYSGIPSLLAEQSIQAFLSQLHVIHTEPKWSLLLMVESTEPVVVTHIPIQKYEIISWIRRLHNDKVLPFAVRLRRHLKKLGSQQSAGRCASVSDLVDQLSNDPENRHGLLSHIVNNGHFLDPIAPLFTAGHTNALASFYPLPLNDSFLEPQAYSDVFVLMLTWNEPLLADAVAGMTEQELINRIKIDGAPDPSQYSKEEVKIKAAEAMESFQVGINAGVSRLHAVFGIDYHYHVDTFEIPSIWGTQAQEKLQIYLTDYHIRRMVREDSLLIIYYGGHGSQVGDDLRFKADRAKVDFSWLDVQWRLCQEVTGDILFVLDCCAAGSSNSIIGFDFPTNDYRQAPSRKAKREILAACTKAGYTYGEYNRELSQILRTSAYEDYPTTVDYVSNVIHRNLHDADPIRIDLACNKILESSIHLQRCNPRLQRFVKDWYGDVLLHPGQVLVIVVKHKRHSNPTNELQYDLFTMICSADRDVEYVMREYWRAMNLSYGEVLLGQFYLRYKSISFGCAPYINHWIFHHNNNLDPRESSPIPYAESAVLPDGPGVGVQLNDLPEYRDNTGPVVFEAFMNYLGDWKEYLPAPGPATNSPTGPNNSWPSPTQPQPSTPKSSNSNSPPWTWDPMTALIPLNLPPPVPTPPAPANPATPKSPNQLVAVRKTVPKRPRPDSMADDNQEQQTPQELFVAGRRETGRVKRVLRSEGLKLEIPVLRRSKRTRVNRMLEEAGLRLEIPEDVGR